MPNLLPTHTLAEEDTMNAKEIRKLVYRSIAAVTRSTDLGSIVGEEVFENMTDADQTSAERVVTEVCDKLEARGAETKPVDYSDGYYKRPPDKKAN